MNDKEGFNITVVNSKLAKMIFIGSMGVTLLSAGTLYSSTNAVPVHTAVETQKIPYKLDLEHALWAKRLQEGSLIVHLRHAQREKWNDVTAFDALELAKGLSAENEGFRRATCLTEQGVEEAKMIGRYSR